MGWLSAAPPSTHPGKGSVAQPGMVTWHGGVVAPHCAAGAGSQVPMASCCASSQLSLHRSSWAGSSEGLGLSSCLESF